MSGGPAKRGSEGGPGRDPAAIVVAVLAAAAVLLAAVALYARTQIIDEDAFADHAVEALSDDAVRQVVSEQIVVQLAERSSADLIAARPLLETVVTAALDTQPFRQGFREAAREANELLFVRERKSVAFKLPDALEVVRFGLQSVSPDLADELPKDLDLTLLTLKKRAFARQSLVIADHVRVLGLVLPLVAMLLLIACVVLSRDRRTGVLRAAFAVAAAGFVLAIVLYVIKSRTLAGIYGSDETTDAELRGAIGGVLDAFFGQLTVWALALGFGGALIAGAAAVLDPDRVDSPATRFRRLLSRPESTAGRAGRGIGALVLGAFVALEPDGALRAAAFIAGAWLVFFGAGELLLLLQPDAEAEAAEAGRRRALRTTALAAGGAVVAVAVAVIAFTGSADDPGTKAVGIERDGCNGSPQLCDLALNQVVFAGTHNSFSAADDPDWFIANQRRTIPRQLADGVRLLLIDPHWGVETSAGHVRTDFEAEGRDRNRVAKALPPATLAAAERLAGDLGLGDASGEREVFLCHTVCELGATRMSDALGEVREFIDENPSEVVILFIEPYVPPVAIEAEFRDAGLLDNVATLSRDQPLPTLDELVESDNRVVVFTEKDADGSLPWYMDGFSYIQDTPLGAERVEDLSCDLNRGDRDSPLLMLNHWADVFPPRRAANVPFQTRKELLGRARQCARERGLPVNMIAVDHYDLGELIPAVAELNRRAAGRARRAGG